MSVKLEEIMKMHQGTAEEAPIAKGIKKTEASGFDCDCYSSDWKVKRGSQIEQ